MKQHTSSSTLTSGAHSIFSRTCKCILTVSRHFVFTGFIIFSEAVKLNTILGEMKEDVIAGACKFWLRYAKDRDGGRQRRTLLKAPIEPEQPQFRVVVGEVKLSNHYEKLQFAKEGKEHFTQE